MNQGREDAIEKTAFTWAHGPRKRCVVVLPLVLLLHLACEYRRRVAGPRQSEVQYVCHGHCKAGVRRDPLVELPLSMYIYGEFFFFVYSLLACDLGRSWRDYVLSVSCPPSAQWRHIASTPLPSAQACPVKL